MNEHEERIEALEQLCDRMNENISSLQTILTAPTEVHRKSASGRLHPNHLGHPALGRKLIPLIKQIGIDLEETK